jgi:hypothetical protein
VGDALLADLNLPIQSNMAAKGWVTMDLRRAMRCSRIPISRFRSCIAVRRSAALA